MPGGALRGRDVELNRVADEGMDEAQRLACKQDLDRSQAVRDRSGLLEGEPRERGGLTERHVVSEDRDRPRQRAGRCPKAADPDAQIIFGTVIDETMKGEVKMKNERSRLNWGSISPNGT